MQTAATTHPRPTSRIAATALMLAAHHADKAKLEGREMWSSAVHCLDEARALYADGEFLYAIRWAQGSLSYSVGVFHSAYKTVTAEAGPDR